MPRFSPHPLALLDRPLAALLLAASIALTPACGSQEDPPGRTLESAADAPVILKAPEPTAAAPQPTTPVDPADPAALDAPAADRPSREATLPGYGAKIASIAMRTWIYVAPRDRSTKLGYLRAGAIVDRAETSAGTDGCAGGWYRIAPRGYVCVGKGASLELEHQITQAAVRGPDRKALLPYQYVISRSPPPHLYFRLPTKEDQERVEGAGIRSNVARFGGLNSAVPLDDVPPFLLAGRDLPKPYGADEKLHYSVHAGKAKEASAFGLITSFEWTGRRFGLTTELDLIPLDRTKPATISALRGVIIDRPNGVSPTADAPDRDPRARADDGAQLIPAIVVQQSVLATRLDEKGVLREAGTVPFRSGWALTGRNNGSERGMLETTEGIWLPAEALRIAKVREDPAGYAREGKKWIDISINRQMLVAYEGKRPVFATLVSTGRGMLGDPEKTQATVRGTFLIHAKHVSGTMDGDEGSDSFELHDVPYIQYFHEGYALHGAYWHDEFGKARSHGCVNLAPADAAWLFEWTDPVVPAEWHGAVNLEGGTLVYTHS